jgi:hypothetical protein
MPPRMTATAWAQGAKNALICAVGVLFVWLAIAVGLWWVFGQGILYSFGLAFAALWCLIFPVFLGTWLYGRNSGGRLLLDCGPHPTRVLFLVNAGLWLILGPTVGLSAPSESKVFLIGGPVFGVSFAAYGLILATGRLQVRENGIWQYWSLVRWGKIGSYRWADDSTLLVKAKGPLSSLLQGALPVPPEHKGAVDEFLSKYCTVQATA